MEGGNGIWPHDHQESELRKEAVLSDVASILQLQRGDKGYIMK